MNTINKERERCRDKYYRNREKYLVKCKDYNRLHKEKIKVYNKIWREEHKEALLAYNRKRRGVNNPSGEIKFGTCPVCKREEIKLYFDHNHETGEFRGWICDRCNRGIGLLKDSIEVVEAALKYLRQV